MTETAVARKSEWWSGGHLADLMEAVDVEIVDAAAGVPLWIRDDFDVFSFVRID